MFSSRLHWDLKPNALTLLLHQKRESGAHILDLTQSNPTAADLEYPDEAIADALSGDFSYEPHSKGLLQAREAISKYYGGAISPDSVILTASTSEAYSYVFKLLCDPGDEILVPRPSYPLFEFLSELESVRVVQYPLDYNGEWTLDTAALEQRVSSRTRAVVLVHPNNPTGAFLKRHEYGALTDICQRRGLPLISDEVFSDYAFGPDDKRLPTLAGATEALTFALSGLSKISGLPQMKLGWIVVSGPENLAAAALHGAELIADTFLSVSTPVQRAAPVLLDIRKLVQPQILKRIRTNLAHVLSTTTSTCLQALALEGGWSVTLRIPGVRSEEDWVLGLLAERDVLVQPGYFYDFEAEAYLVLSLLTREPEFREGVARMIEYVDAAVEPFH